MDDMRNLGLSEFLNKNLEWFLFNWIWPVASQFVTPDQLGGQKGSSTSHYLARLIQYIYEELDGSVQRDRKAVLAMTVPVKSL